jgi:hypothetical protein
MVLFSLPFFMDLLCNDPLLRLFECIESIKSDVKKKMTLTRACDPYTKVTEVKGARNFPSREAAIIFFSQAILGKFVWSAHVRCISSRGQTASAVEVFRRDGICSSSLGRNGTII